MPPVAIGHAVGGLVAQKLLGQNKLCAGVAICPAPMKGVTALPLARLRSALPVLCSPLDTRRVKGLTRRRFREVFGNAVPERESDSLWEQWSIPSPVRPLL